MQPADDPFVIIARGVVHEHRRDDAIELFRRALQLDETEDGTVIQAFHFEQYQPNVVWFYELWTGDDAVEVHRRNHGPALRAQLRGVFKEWPVLHYLTPLFAKGLDLDALLSAAGGRPLNSGVLSKHDREALAQSRHEAAVKHDPSRAVPRHQDDDR